MKSVYYILIFLSFLANAQTKTGLTNEELKKAKESYLQMMDSDEYKMRKNLINKFATILDMKTGAYFSAKHTTQESSENWFDKNLPQEKINDAKENLRAMNELSGKLLENYKEMWKLIDKAPIDQRKEIMHPELLQIKP